MFQYALGLCLSYKNDCQFRIDVRGFKRYKLHKYNLHHFNISADIARKEDLEKIGRIYTSSIATRIAMRIVRKLKALCFGSLVLERSLLFDPAIMSLAGNAYLDGYWQNEKYFIEIESIIRKEFTLKKMSKEAEEVRLLIENENNPVSIHVRRGDYAVNPKILSLTLDYYQNAINLIYEKIKKPSFFVFSDDIKWVKQNLKLDNASFVSSPKIAPQEDLMLMSYCKYNIIANSSFSWWGAWLNKNKEKIVIAPQKLGYREDRGMGSNKDMMPKKWITIKND